MKSVGVHLEYIRFRGYRDLTDLEAYKGAMTAISVQRIILVSNMPIPTYSVSVQETVIKASLNSSMLQSMLMGRNLNAFIHRRYLLKFKLDI